MKIQVLADAEAVAREAARVIASEARTAVARRGSFIMAVSGGRTPWQMLRALAGEDVPWKSVQVVQVDERVAPAGHADRNLTHIRESLLDQASLSPEQIRAMPVEEKNLDVAARDYALTLERIAGSPPILDLIHLGWDRTDTRLRSCPAIRFSRSPIVMWRRRVFISSGDG